MATKIVELSAEHLDDGEFLPKLNSEFEQVVRAFAKFCKKHENSKAKAKLKVEIVLEENESGIAVITTGFKKDLPGTPNRKSTAMFDINDLDEATLFCQSSGADEHDPAQSRMFDPNDNDE